MKVEQQMRVVILGPYGPGDNPKMGQELAGALQAPAGAQVTGYDHSHFSRMGGDYITLIVSLQRVVEDAPLAS